MNDLNEVIGEIKQTRDELRVRAHLLKSETKDKMHELEAKWQHLYGEISPTMKATKLALKDIGAANQLLLSEIREGYQRIRKTLH